MTVSSLADRSRADLARIGLEFMLAPYFTSRALMPQLAMRFDPRDVPAVAIDEWMGASPVYTARLRRLMGIEGDDVGAILKALQLDVGFVHGFMDVAYELRDPHYAEFWLNHCGALVDTEPRGEMAVIAMCHHIEDPTFDATAVATNPRARIRPIHRPPRAPVDRLPHCRWSIAIDPAIEPVQETAITGHVRALPLASVPNLMPDDREPGGWRDYRRPFEPAFRLSHLSHGALVAVLREFQMQMHLLVASTDLVVRARYGREASREILDRQWAAVNWLVSERLRPLLGGTDTAALAHGVAMHPGWPPDATVTVEIAGTDRLRVTVTLPADATAPEGAGWGAVLGNGSDAGVAALVQGFDAHAEVRPGGAFAWDVALGARGVAAAEPPILAMVRGSAAAGWRFR